MSESAPLIASALKYSVNDNAPRVIAQGSGRLAQQIIDLAAEHGIEIVQNDLLAADLHALAAGHEIPERLYVIVAEILSAIFAKSLYQSSNRS